LQNQNATSDNIILEVAIQQKRIVITKDQDFLVSFLLNSKPEKLIIVRTGNITNKLLLKLFNDNLEIIKLMISRSNLIEISKSEIAEHQ
jgi:predicted nuclease of predicted toxin-antitoxin system